MTTNGVQPGRRLGFVMTGGTIATIDSGETGHKALAVSAGAPEQAAMAQWLIADALGGEARGLAVSHRVPFWILSENARSANWRVLAQAVAQLINDGVDGVVVTHGTDTLVYTAAALSFMLGALPVPVILTGSMLSYGDAGSDARQNLAWSIRAALDPRTPREVAIMFGGGAIEVTAYYAGVDRFSDVYGTQRLDQILIRGTRARKVSAWSQYFSPPDRRYAAFQSIHADILGAVPAGADRLIFSPHAAAPSRPAGDAPGRHQLIPQTALDPRVVVLRIYPDIDPQLLTFLVRKAHYRGLILEAYGDGALPSSPAYSLLPAIGQATRAKACVCITSSPLGPATTQTYEGNSGALDMGAVALSDMTTECALVKLMWLLGQVRDVSRVRDLMARDLAGEIMTRELRVMV